MNSTARRRNETQGTEERYKFHEREGVDVLFFQRTSDKRLATKQGPIEKSLNDNTHQALKTSERPIEKGVISETKKFL